MVRTAHGATWDELVDASESQRLAWMNGLLDEIESVEGMLRRDLIRRAVADEHALDDEALDHYVLTQLRALVDRLGADTTAPAVPALFRAFDEMYAESPSDVAMRRATAYRRAQRMIPAEDIDMLRHIVPELRRHLSTASAPTVKTHGRSDPVAERPSRKCR